MALPSLQSSINRDIENEKMALLSCPEIEGFGHSRFDVHRHHFCKLRSPGESSSSVPQLALSVYSSRSLSRVDVRAFPVVDSSVNFIWGNARSEDSQLRCSRIGKTMYGKEHSVISETMEPFLIDGFQSLPGVTGASLEPQEAPNSAAFTPHFLDSDINGHHNWTRCLEREELLCDSVAFDRGKNTMCTVETLDESIYATELSLKQGTAVSLQTYFHLLQVCTRKRDLAAGRRIHSLLVNSGLDSVVIVGDYLIRLFDSCGSLQEADVVFSKVSKPTVYTWHAIIAAHSAHGENDRALELFYKMEQTGVKPNEFVYSRVLNACSSTLALEQGRLIHNDIIASELQSDLFVGSTLVDLYAKCGSLQDARRVFDRLPRKNVVTWGAMISGYAQHKLFHPALELIEEMNQETLEPNEVIFSCILRACGSIGALSQGRLIHGEITKLGLECNVLIRIALVYMYAKCSSLRDAQEGFGMSPDRNLELWNTMVAGYVECGQYLPALETLEKMGKEGIAPDKITFSCSLKACASLGNVSLGMVMHDQIIKAELESDVFIGSGLVDMYCKCGSLEDGQRVFDQLPYRNAVSWGALISGYVQNDDGLSALNFYWRMQEAGVIPNEFTFSCALKACGSIGAIEQGGLIHDQVIRSGLTSCVFVGSSLVDMYAKCGSLEAAQKVFDELPDKGIVSWGALINGYVQHGHPLDAIQIYENMKAKHIMPDKIVFLSVLEACGRMGAIGLGKQIHKEIITSGFASNVSIGNTLIEMYANCGSVEEAWKVFDGLQNRNLVSWSAMIAAYMQNGNCDLARQCFQYMLKQGLMPDAMMYTTILAACSHAGQVEEGQKYFRSLKDHGLSPSIEHFGCLVNILGEKGLMSEAEELLETMPVPPDSTVWMSLLTACRTNGKVGLGRQCFDQVVRFDPGIAAGYALMSNIYADAGLWENVLEIQELRRCADAWKKPAKAWIEVDGRIHEFLAGDKSHSQSQQIYANLRQLTVRMKNEGYRPHLGVVVKPTIGLDKEETLLGHSEKLAISFGLLATPRGATIRVTKNLRMCTDCHHASEIISRIEEREIIINDAYRIHHFIDGVCSCGEQSG